MHQRRRIHRTLQKVIDTMSDEVTFFPPSPNPEPTVAVTTMTAAHTLPVICLTTTVILPHTVMSIPLTEENTAAVEASKQYDRHILIAVRNPQLDEQADYSDVIPIATLGKIEQIGRMPGPSGGNAIVVRGIRRVHITAIEVVDSLPMVAYRDVEESYEHDDTLVRLKLEVHAAIDAVIELRPEIPQEIRNFVRNIADPRQLADNTGYSPDYTLAERITLLTTIDVHERLRFVRDAYRKLFALLEVQQRIRQEVEDGTAKQQREFYLRQQLRAIQKELGEDSESLDDITELRERLAAAKLSDAARKEADRELLRLQRMGNSSAESHVVRTYLEWLADLPWQTYSATPIDVAHTRTVLDADHDGLDAVKDRILEYLAVRRRKQQQPTHNGERSHEPILALVGPPGVGKTSLGQSIATALGRKFVRMSLGGVRDEAELRGFRRTYIGSAPGRIIQELRRTGTADPVILLDEIDKLGNDFRGDPASALLEVLDPEQNDTFTDHYLNVPFDLSHVLFIATANTIDTIPLALRDRLEIIELSSYVETEKRAIAQHHLIPKQARANALDPHNVAIADSALATLIGRYTRESGVRGLERQIGTVMRKVARQLEEHPDTALPIVIDEAWLYANLGNPRFSFEEREPFVQPGIATGMVWTAVGGDIVYVEAAIMPGNKELRITGQLGDVMRESVEAALSCVRSRAQELGIDAHFFDTRALHVHVPGGAVPKDGPSAGITLATAIASAATGRLVRDDVAMTGEITLRGRVLPVGGIREKLLGAYRAGIRTIVLSRRNLVDVDEVPQHIREHLEIIAVDSIDQVFHTVLREPAVTVTA